MKPWIQVLIKILEVIIFALGLYGANHKANEIISSLNQNNGASLASPGLLPETRKENSHGQK
jgi:hypothetical protein